MDEHPIKRWEAEELDRLWSRIDLIAAGNQRLIDELHARIPVDIYEAAYIATATSLTTAPVTSQMIRATAVVATIPSGATGLLQLGPVTIPLGTPTTNLVGLRIQLRAADLRRLSATKSGPMALLVCGEMMPTPWPTT